MQFLRLYKEKRPDTLLYQTYFSLMVPRIGLEPTWFSPIEPESIVSTSFTTWAGILNYRLFLFLNKE